MGSIIFGFLGGFTGDFIKSTLDLMVTKHDFVSIAGNTRISVKIMSDGKETEVNGNSPDIFKSDFQSLILKLKKLDKGMLIMSGSVLSSLGYVAYNEIAENLSKNIQLIIDNQWYCIEKNCRSQSFFNQAKY